MKTKNFATLKFAIIFLFLFLNNTLYSQKPEAIRLFNSGIESEKSNNYDEAAAYFTMAINLEPNYYEAIFHRGNACRNITNYNQALMDFTKLLMLKNTSENYINRAKIFQEMNDYKNVLSDLFKAIQLNNNSDEAYYNRALLYHDKLEYDSAIADLQKCFELNPDFEDAQNKLALLQKYKDSQTDSLKKTPEQQQNLADTWIDDFSDSRMQIVSHKKNTSNIMTASTFKNDVGIKREIKQPVDKINNHEQLQNSEKTVQDRSSINEVSKEPHKQNELNNSPVVKNTVDNNYASLKNDKTEVPILTIKSTEQQLANKTGTEKLTIVETNDLKQNDNTDVDNNKARNNATGLQNNKMDLQISSTNTPAQQLTEKNTSEKLTNDKNPDLNKATGRKNNNIDLQTSTIDTAEIENKDKTNSLPDAVNSEPLKRNDDVIAENTNAISKSESAEGSTIVHKSNGKLYSIQLGAFENEMNANELTGKVKNMFDYDVNSYESSGLFKVRLGDYQLTEALMVIKKVRQSGFTDAIIVESNN